jgi:hypothetical protein
VVTPALGKMAAADSDIALRKIDLSDLAGDDNVTQLPHAKVIAVAVSPALLSVPPSTRSRVTSRRLKVAEVSRPLRFS